MPAIRRAWPPEKTCAWGAGGSLMQNVHCGFADANTRIIEDAPNYAGLHSEVIDGGMRAFAGAMESVR